MGSGAVVFNAEYSEEEVSGPRGSFFCPERVPVNRAQGWLMVNIIWRRGRAFLGKLSIVKPDESTWQVFQSSEVFLKAQKTWT